MCVCVSKAVTEQGLSQLKRCRGRKTKQKMDFRKAEYMSQNPHNLKLTLRKFQDFYFLKLILFINLTAHSMQRS